MKMEKIDCKSPLANKMSSAQLRKIKKPIIEKRRRERINDSLNQLKALVLDAMQKDESRYSKMEKADILEMTVHHLKNVHRRQSMMSATEEQEQAQKYNAGFTECAKEVGQFLGSIDGLTPELRLRMMSYLSQRIAQQQQQQPTAARTPQAPITPAPVVLSPIYSRDGPVSPPQSAVTTPCSTTLASLPGSPAQYHSLSPVMVTSQVTSPILIVSPHSSPAHSPTGAIPLYSQKYSSSVSPAPSYSGYSSGSDSRTSSPDLAEEVPHEEAQPHSRHVFRDTVIAKNNASCASHARLVACHKDNMMADRMWRPW